MARSRSREGPHSPAADGGRPVPAEPVVTAPDAEMLLDLADSAIVAGLDGRPPPLADRDRLPAPLREPVGAFVTLTVRGDLNGCIGVIESEEPIGAAVGPIAHQAAFADPRLPALRRRDYRELRIEVSVLSPLARVSPIGRDELLASLRPGRDGLVVHSGDQRAVFLPKVWDQLPAPGEFLDQLLRKAGLAPEVWSAEFDADVFTTASFARPAR